MDGLTFVSFKGCGHMVPSDNPSGAYDMINAFLNGKIMNIVKFWMELLNNLFYLKNL